MKPSLACFRQTEQTVRRKTRDLVLAVLRATATKREARQYVQKYSGDGPKRVSIVRVGGTIDSRLGWTLAQIKALGAHPVVVLDPSVEAERFITGTNSFESCQDALAERAGDLCNSIASYMATARPLLAPFDLSIKHGLTTQLPRLCGPLDLDIIPVVTPITFDQEMAEFRLTEGHKAVKSVVEAFKSAQNYALDKIIFIDAVGGLPSMTRMASHVQVNIRQELGDITSEIRGSNLDAKTKLAHLSNLNSMSVLLGMLPPSVTGIITSPTSAGEVMDRNPIVYNILTDRPLISSSLPFQLGRTQLETTVLRQGTPVFVHEDADGLDLEKLAKIGRINLAKLVRLIELSFQKTLDLDHYLGRIKNNVAAVIVVGDYEGAAIITWEKSPITGRKVAYLDKLAVLPSSQGAAGVADIILNRMIRSLFPEEVIWRSRANNPVNKWYFERSRGFLRLQNPHWVMFWHCTTSRPPILEYAAICGAIEPSLRSE